ncbi:hypothetical protein OAK19_02980 [Aureispira]|nr:hypothetical protein [Aureispira sp.]
MIYHSIDRANTYKKKAYLSLVSSSFIFYFLYQILSTNNPNLIEHLSFKLLQGDILVALGICLFIIGCNVYFWPKRNTSKTEISFFLLSIIDKQIFCQFFYYRFLEIPEITTKISNFKSSQNLFDYINSIRHVKKYKFRGYPKALFSKSTTPKTPTGVLDDNFEKLDLSLSKPKTLLKNIDQIISIERTFGNRGPARIHESIEYVDSEFRKNYSPVSYKKISKAGNGGIEKFVFMFKNNESVSIVLTFPFGFLRTFLSKNNIHFEKHEKPPSIVSSWSDKWVLKTNNNS